MKCKDCFYCAKCCDGTHFCYAHYPQFTDIDPEGEACEDFEPE